MSRNISIEESTMKTETIKYTVGTKKLLELYNHISSSSSLSLFDSLMLFYESNNSFSLLLHRLSRSHCA